MCGAILLDVLRRKTACLFSESPIIIIAIIGGGVAGTRAETNTFRNSCTMGIHNLSYQSGDILCTYVFSASVAIRFDWIQITRTLCACVWGIDYNTPNKLLCVLLGRCFM